MCLAIPMKIVEIEGVTAITEVDGVKRRIRLDLLPAAGVGDYVLVHAGLAIARLDESAARETLELLHKLADEIQ